MCIKNTWTKILSVIGVVILAEILLMTQHCGQFQYRMLRILEDASHTSRKSNFKVQNKQLTLIIHCHLSYKITFSLSPWQAFWSKSNDSNYRGIGLTHPFNILISPISQTLKYFWIFIMSTLNFIYFSPSGPSHPGVCYSVR